MFCLVTGTSRHFVVDKFLGDIQTAKVKCVEAISQFLLAPLSPDDPDVDASSLSGMLRLRNGLDFHEDKLVLHMNDELFFANLNFVFEPKYMLVPDQYLPVTSTSAPLPMAADALYHLSIESVDRKAQLTPGAKNVPTGTTETKDIQIQALREVDFVREWACDQGSDSDHAGQNIGSGGEACGDKTRVLRQDNSVLRMKQRHFRRMLIAEPVPVPSSASPLETAQDSQLRSAFRSASMSDQQPTSSAGKQHPPTPQQKQNDVRDLLDFANYLVSFLAC